MPHPRGGAAVIRMSDGRVLYAGGFDAQTAARRPAHERGRLRPEHRTLDGDGCAERHPLRYRVRPVLPDGRVLLAGGWRWAFGLAVRERSTAPRRPSCSIPSSLTWTPTGAMTVGAWRRRDADLDPDRHAGVHRRPLGHQQRRLAAPTRKASRPTTPPPAPGASSRRWPAVATTTARSRWRTGRCSCSADTPTRTVRSGSSGNRRP